MDNRNLSIVGFIVLLVALLIAVVLHSVFSQEPVEQEDLNGRWESVGDDFAMTAFVENDDFQIELHLADGTRGLYWKGNFPLPEETSSEFSIFSQADSDALELSLFGSNLEEKEFVYNSGNIEFEFTILGTTRTISMEKI